MVYYSTDLPVTETKYDVTLKVTAYSCSTHEFTYVWTAYGGTVSGTLGDGNWLITSRNDGDEKETTSVKVEIALFGADCVFDMTWSHSTVSVSNFYVKTGGSDSKDGTSWTEAWATVDKAMTTVADGKTIHIGYGTYSSEPANNKVFPQNIGSTGIGIKIEDDDGTGGTVGDTVKIEVNRT